MSKPDAVAVPLIPERARGRIALDRYAAPSVPVDDEPHVTVRTVTALPNDQPAEGRIDSVVLDLFRGERSPGDEVLSACAANDGKRQAGRLGETETRERRTPRIAGIQADGGEKLRHFRPVVRSDFLNPEVYQRRIEMRRGVITLR